MGNAARWPAQQPRPPSACHCVTIIIFTIIIFTLTFTIIIHNNIHKIVPLCHNIHLCIQSGRLERPWDSPAGFTQFRNSEGKYNNRHTRAVAMRPQPPPRVLPPCSGPRSAAIREKTITDTRTHLPSLRPSPHALPPWSGPCPATQMTLSPRGSSTPFPPHPQPAHPRAPALQHCRQ